MPRINLLPWRDEERKERKLKFLVALGGAAVGACLLAFVGYLTMDSMIGAQEARNQKLKEQIAELDKQIEKINSLEADKARFIARCWNRATVPPMDGALSINRNCGPKPDTG